MGSGTSGERVGLAAAARGWWWWWWWICKGMYIESKLCRWERRGEGFQESVSIPSTSPICSRQACSLSNHVCIQAN